MPGNCYCYTRFHNNSMPNLHTDILVLTAALPCYHRLFPTPLFTRHIPHCNRPHEHYYTNSTPIDIYFFFFMDHMPHEIFPFVFNLIFFCTLTLKNFFLSFLCMFSHSVTSKLLQNCQVLTSSSSHGIMNLLHSKLSLWCLWHHLPHADWLLHFSKFPMTHFLAKTLVAMQYGY